MLAVFCAMACKDRNDSFKRGYKNRVSISPSNRSKWNGQMNLQIRLKRISHLGEMTQPGWRTEFDVIRKW